MVFERLISQKNLKLAWRRITTGTNHQYKRYFRDLYYPYEIAIDENIKNLQDRLKGGGGIRPWVEIKDVLKNHSIRMAILNNQRGD